MAQAAIIRVAAYCRVSTENMDQNNSFESQKTFFREYIDKQQDWLLYDIYADEGITGTSTRNRSGFLRMVNDAYKGCFDLIITKEVSRFSRNLLDTITYTRTLKKHGVGVLFMNDGISTKDDDAELRLSIMASIAQEESRKTSERVKWGQRIKMEHGTVFGPSLLGYDVKDGAISIEPEGASVIRMIYRLYLNGNSAGSIASLLTNMGISTKTGKESWSGASVLKILKNEKYCGDLIQRKTITQDFLTHKKSVNRNIADMICLHSHHEPIIDREQWQAVQFERQRRAGTGLQTVHGNRYPLSGRISCAGCGAVYFCRTRRDINGEIYRAWACLNCTCGSKHRQLREDVLALCVREMMVSFISNDHVSASLRNISETLRYKQENDIILKKDSEQLEKKRTRLAEAYLSDVISREDYLLLRDKLLKQQSILHQRINQKGNDDEHTMNACFDVAKRLLTGEDAEDNFYLQLIDSVVATEFKQLIKLKNENVTWELEIN